MNYYEMSPSMFFNAVGVVGKIPSLCVNMLEKNGYKTMLDVVSSTPEEIMKVPNVGASCLLALNKAMEIGGLSFVKLKENFEETDMFKMSITYLKSLGYSVVLTRGEVKTF